MNGSDRWFRWSLNIFVFLMCVQLGMLLFLKSLFYQAEQRMENNKAEVAFTCGDHNKETSYWKLPESPQLISKECDGKACPESFWSNAKNQEKKLHVLSVLKAQPSRIDKGEVKRGYFVDVEVESFEDPTTLVLISQTMMQWNLHLTAPTEKVEKFRVPSIDSRDLYNDVLTRTLYPSQWYAGGDTDWKNIVPFDWYNISLENLQEVLALGPELVWIEGLREKTKVTYFDKDQLCAFPLAWEEIENPNNQFRRLFLALKEYTNIEISSFQGKEVGRNFNVPYLGPIEAQQVKIPLGRSISSEPQIRAVPFENGITWKRHGKTLKAVGFNYKKGGRERSMEIPDSVTHAYLAEAQSRLYVISNYQFGFWDWEQKRFQPIHLPLSLQGLYWPTAMTFNPLRSELYIYNDDRGGEIYAYNVVKKQWKILAKKVGYSVVSLLFDRETETLFGSRYKGRQITEILALSKYGKMKGVTQLERPVDFAKNKWRVELVPRQKKLWLKVAHPARPEGDLHLLPDFSQAL